MNEELNQEVEDRVNREGGRLAKVISQALSDARDPAMNGQEANYASMKALLTVTAIYAVDLKVPDQTLEGTIADYTQQMANAMRVAHRLIMKGMPHG
ncbi:hypothetical protein [Prosthecobacter dejongeii]|uniref:Uncharacterized protein n=1 Tax=Prosthecobacter dejongeii TaxID=48465 RepID=A0A7W7YL57_9BACT|nr:hypothetical protein [Prosthecobacter dejongeii]MBB5038243.1 hypothetical protein [Prosthecobacter dejongeii]